ncbi:MAG: SpaA isopeptide-forming pilin-related protein [Eggerthellaceae bacterium]|jgi:fimbrial isopeptide formation D2 family protein
MGAMFSERRVGASALMAVVAVLVAVFVGGAVVSAWAQSADEVGAMSSARDSSIARESGDAGAEAASTGSGAATRGDGRVEAGALGPSQAGKSQATSLMGSVVAESDSRDTVTAYSLFHLFDASGAWASSESRTHVVAALVELDRSYADPPESPQSEYAAREALGASDPSEAAAALARAFAGAPEQVKVSAQETVSVEPGAYLAVPDNGAGAALFEVRGGETKQLFAKNSLPSLDKQVSRDGSSFGCSVAAGRGEDVAYRLVVGLPPDAAERSPYRLTVVDAPCEGVDVDASTVAVFAGGAAVSANEYEVVWNEDARVLSIRFDDVSVWTNGSGSTLRVEYRARLNDRAVMGGGGNSNTARIVTDYGEVPSQPAIVYTFGLVVEKSAADTGSPLEGAAFQLFGEEGDVRAEGATDSDGRISFERIGEGAYTLREISAPQGYRPVADIPVTVEAVGEDGSLVLEARVGSGGDALVDVERGLIAVAVRDSPDVVPLEAPQTGDRLRLGVLAVTAAAAAATVLMAARRRRLNLMRGNGRGSGVCEETRR